VCGRLPAGLAEGGLTLSETFQYEPIGVIRTPFREIKGTPIQGVFAQGETGTVEIDARYEEGLRDIERFSHAFLLYAFHRSALKSLTVVPFLDDAAHGVFATRAPCRPNAIGLSIVRILGRRGCRIEIADVDVLDRTPLLDIKPYVPRFDCRLDATSGWLTGRDSASPRERADDRFA
jgi:tRNA-Thr(GGU) m(6)t(6)A37 methyltransferase TsaA